VAESDRDERGRFLPGHGVRSKNPGRKSRAFELAYLEILKGLVEEEDWSGMITKQIERAKEGNLRALMWFADRLMGKVPEKIQLGRLPPEVEQLDED